ncbi:MAG: helix-turn-helix domain-containing protein [Candidatus Sericytochromatia bacterium]|nr:helix-turn-helix domain-containing protein [Candidatus Sericytochromatia bacterium]
MGLGWHLTEHLARVGLEWAALEARLGFPVPPDLRGAVPPIDLSLPVLADLCQALGCQPGELLSWQPDDPAEQAERTLAQDRLFQSFLAYKQGGDGLTF